MHIVFVGIAGVFKQNRALDSRLRYFAQLFTLDNKVSVINRYCSSNMLTDPLNIPKDVDYFDIIRPRKTSGFISKLLMFFSIIKEPFVLFKINKKTHVDIIHIYTEHFYNLLLYRILSRLISAKTVCQYVEYSSFFNHKNFLNRINCKLYDKYIPKLCDGIIPISVFLDNKIKEINPLAKTIKVNPLCDFKFFSSVTPKQLDKPYLLYCGSITYFDAIDLVSRAYNDSCISKMKDIVFVLSGSKDRIKEFADKNPNYIILSKLEYNDLIAYYKGAFALLIPLQNKITDIARYPNKVGEYLASNGLIITTDVGEISYLFKDGINAIVADEFDVSQLTKKMNDLELGNYNISTIKDNAYEIGLQYFDIVSYRMRMNVFLRSLL